MKLSDDVRAKIGKYSCENSDSAAARHTWNLCPMLWAVTARK